MKRAAILLGIVVVAYLATWTAFGERALLNRDTGLIWADSDVVEYSHRYTAELPHVLCTDLTDQRTLKRHGRSARVLTLDECFGDGSDLLRRAEAEIVSEESDLGLIIGVAEVSYPNPLVAKNSVQIWFYGTDYTEYREEWLTWMFVAWVPVFRQEGGVGKISPEQDA